MGHGVRRLVGTSLAAAAMVAAVGCTGEDAATPTSGTPFTNPNPQSVDEVATRALQAIDARDIAALETLTSGPITRQQVDRLAEVGDRCSVDMASLEIVPSETTPEAQGMAARVDCPEGDFRIGSTLDSSGSQGTKWEIEPDWLPGGSHAAQVTDSGLSDDLASLPPLP